MVYEFRCRHCGRRFEVYATLKEKEAGLSPTCPRCGSGEVMRVFTPVLLLRRQEPGSSDRPSREEGGTPEWEREGGDWSDSSEGDWEDGSDGGEWGDGEDDFEPGGGAGGEGADWEQAMKDLEGLEGLEGLEEEPGPGGPAEEDWPEKELD